MSADVQPHLMSIFFLHNGDCARAHRSSCGRSRSSAPLGPATTRSRAVITSAASSAVSCERQQARLSTLLACCGAVRLASTLATGLNCILAFLRSLQAAPSTAPQARSARAVSSCLLRSLPAAGSRMNCFRFWSVSACGLRSISPRSWWGRRSFRHQPMRS